MSAQAAVASRSASGSASGASRNVSFDEAMTGLLAALKLLESSKNGNYQSSADRSSAAKALHVASKATPSLNDSTASGHKFFAAVTAVISGFRNLYNSASLDKALNPPHSHNIAISPNERDQILFAAFASYTVYWARQEQGRDWWARGLEGLEAKNKALGSLGRAPLKSARLDQTAHADRTVHYGMCRQGTAGEFYLITAPGTDLWRDWLINLKADLVDLMVAGQNYRVHNGIKTVALEAWNHIRPHLQAAIDAGLTQIVCAGHSLGGGIVSIIALFAQESFPLTTVNCYTFGSAAIVPSTLTGAAHGLKGLAIGFINCKQASSGGWRGDVVPLIDLALVERVMRRFSKILLNAEEPPLVRIVVDEMPTATGIEGDDSKRGSYPLGIPCLLVIKDAGPVTQRGVDFCLKQFPFYSIEAHAVYEYYSRIQKWYSSEANNVIQCHSCL